MTTATPEKVRQAAPLPVPDEHQSATRWQSDPLPAPAEFLGNADAAVWLGVSPERLRQSRSLGTLCGCPAPAFLKLGTKSRVRYRVSVLRAWLEEHSTEHTPKPTTAAAGQ